jgi:EamA domain-containing membrane protein RarD
MWRAFFWAVCGVGFAGLILWPVETVPWITLALCVGLTDAV